jgi:Ca-activated chloride channel family protein
MVIITLIPALVFLVAVIAEKIHQRRCSRMGRLAFGPEGAPRVWTRLAPMLRVLSLTALTWSLLFLFLLQPKVAVDQQRAPSAYRHLIMVLDVSPSMKIPDAGMERKQTRSQRASVVLTTIFDRVLMDQTKVNVIAVYTGAKPVITETTDRNVIKNILDELPLEFAFDFGKTKLIDGINLAAEQAKNYPEESTTVIIASDGDTVPEKGMTAMPKSVSKVLLLGLGSHQGEFIDGHQSRQDAPTLRSIARRLGGEYHDVNVRFLPDQAIKSLSESVPLTLKRHMGLRELAMGLALAASALLALLPVALTLLGSRWHAHLNAGRNE